MVFHVESMQGSYELTLKNEKLFAIGYAGRSREKTMEHIRELERELGVPAPKRIPTIFQCSTCLLTQEDQIAFVGGDTSGEVEYVLVKQGEKLFVGVGSDHTDRKLESSDVLKAKQLCAKPIGRVLWPYEEVKDHWDSLQLESRQRVEGKELQYQKGTVAEILPPEEILKQLAERVGEAENMVVFSGTVPTLQGYRFGDGFYYSMTDPVLGRSIQAGYDMELIPEEER